MPMPHAPCMHTQLWRAADGKGGHLHTHSKEYAAACEDKHLLDSFPSHIKAAMEAYRLKHVFIMCHPNIRQLVTSRLKEEVSGCWGCREWV